jgi:ornithine--oxo-acid transaminase
MIAVNNMGHNHPKIINASIVALKAGATINLAFQSPYYGQLAKRVTQVFIS